MLYNCIGQDMDLEETETEPGGWEAVKQKDSGTEHAKSKSAVSKIMGSYFI